jgi:hypothetical protein
VKTQLNINTYTLFGRREMLKREISKREIGEKLAFSLVLSNKRKIK